jgi:hypothetical protein
MLLDIDRIAKQIHTHNEIEDPWGFTLDRGGAILGNAIHVVDIHGTVRINAGNKSGIASSQSKSSPASLRPNHTMRTCP